MTAPSELKNGLKVQHLMIWTMNSVASGLMKAMSRYLAILGKAIRNMSRNIPHLSLIPIRMSIWRQPIYFCTLDSSFLADYNNYKLIVNLGLTIAKVSRSLIRWQETDSSPPLHKNHWVSMLHHLCHQLLICWTEQLLGRRMGWWEGSISMSFSGF